MRKIFLLTILALIISAFSNCSQTNEPKPPEYKDPREMTWTADTLEYPGAIQTLMNSIWASSPIDVYAVGHCDENEGSLWHYDGEEWKSLKIFDFIGRGSLGLREIYGFSQDDFWIVGKRNGIRNLESLIVNFDGDWHDHIMGYTSRILDINGNSSNNIWFCGSEGFVLYLEHGYPRADTVEVDLPPQTEFAVYGIGLLQDETLLLAKAYNPELQYQIHYCIKGNLQNWTIVDSLVFPPGNWPTMNKWGNHSIFQLDDKNIYSYGGFGVWRWNIINDKWENSLLVNYFINGMFGLDSNYLIATSDFGKLYYKNDNWIELTNLFDGQENFHFTNGWTNGSEMFLLGLITDSFPMRTIIIHGK